jgi:hypothetical protein
MRGLLLPAHRGPLPSRCGPEPSMRGPLLPEHRGPLPSRYGPEPSMRGPQKHAVVAMQPIVAQVKNIFLLLFIKISSFNKGLIQCLLMLLIYFIFKEL